MPRNPRHRRPILWFALLAFLMSLLAPMAHAAPHGDGMPWSELCSSTGGKASPGAPAVGIKHLLEHCPGCAAHVDSFALPPTAPELNLPPSTAHAEPAAFLHAPHTLHAWRRAQPRAPPVLA